MRDNRLTETQERRALAQLAGKSIREIAADEGRAPSSIAESLSAPAVRSLIQEELTRIKSIRETKTGEVHEPLSLLLQNLFTIALEATKPHPLGGKVKDYRMRFDATRELLRYYDVPASGATVGEVVREVKRQITATETIRSRTSPVQNGAAT